MPASTRVPRADLALNVLTRLHTLSPQESSRLSELLSAGVQVWSAAEASFNELCEAHDVGVASVYEQNFEVGAALDNLTATAASSHLPRDVIEVMVTCTLAAMHPECAYAAGDGVYQALVLDPVELLGTEIGG